MNWPLTETISAKAVSGGLRTAIIGRHVLFYRTLGSTMDAAREAALAGADEGTVVIADEQTAGRGRLRRTWFSPRGNIALSVILRPSRSELSSMVMLAALAAAGAIESASGLSAGIKWPNDILVGGRKVCGILIETDAGGCGYSIIGVGINVNLDPAQYAEIEATATSLSREAGKPVSRLAVARLLLEEMDGLYRRLKSGASLVEDWRQKLVTLGRPVTVASPEGSYEGVAETVDVDGSLMVRLGDGSLRRVVAGDVTLNSRSVWPPA